MKNAVSYIKFKWVGRFEGIELVNNKPAGGKDIKSVIIDNYTSWLASLIYL